MSNRATVAILRTESYAACDSQIERAAELLNFNPDVADRMVLLKPNLRSGASPEKAINTHPEFVRGVIRFFVRRKAKVLVGDSCGVYGFTSRCFQTSGLAEVILKEGAGIINFDKDRIITEQVNGKVLKRVFLPETVRCSHLIVTMPKLKTHSYTGMTGAMKNHIGFLPGGTKARLHQDFPGIVEFSEAVLDLNLHIPVQIAFVDGILGMEGNGPARGSTRQANVMIAGIDLAAVDVIASQIMGIEPTSAPILLAAARRGAGLTNPTDIHTVGDSLDSVKTRFVPATPKSSETRPWLYKVRNRQKEKAVKIVLTKNDCPRCAYCIQICPVRAITMKKHPVIDQKLCIHCYTCYENCPARAFKLKLNPWVKKMVTGQISGSLFP